MEAQITFIFLSDAETVHDFTVQSINIIFYLFNKHCLFLLLLQVY